MKIGSILHFHSLKGAFDKSPEFSLDCILRSFAVDESLLLEIFLLEGVALLLEGTQGVFLTLLEAKILAVDEALCAVPIRLGYMLKRRVETERVVSKLAAIANQHPVQVSTFVAKFANSFGISFSLIRSFGGYWFRRETVQLRCSKRGRCRV